MEIHSVNPVKLFNSDTSEDLEGDDGLGAVGDYAEKLIREINNFVSDTGNLIVSIFQIGLLIFLYRVLKKNRDT